MFDFKEGEVWVRDWVANSVPRGEVSNLRELRVLKPKLEQHDYRKMFSTLAADLTPTQKMRRMCELVEEYYRE
jgi:hypothetical protein